MRRHKLPSTTWVPWAIAGVSLLGSVSFTVVDHLLQAAKVEGQLARISADLDWVRTSLIELAENYQTKLMNDQQKEK